MDIGEGLLYDWMLNQGKDIASQKRKYCSMKKPPKQKLEKTTRNNLVPSKQYPKEHYRSWHSPWQYIWRQARGKGVVGRGSHQDKRRSGLPSLSPGTDVL